VESGTAVPPRKSFLQQLKPSSGVDREAPFLPHHEPGLYIAFLCPSTLWVITTYGLYIGPGGLAFNFVFPIKIVGAPYHWPEHNSGLHSVATIVGYLLALPLLPVSDKVAAYRTRQRMRSSGSRDATSRLDPRYVRANSLSRLVRCRVYKRQYPCLTNSFFSGCWLQRASFSLASEPNGTSTGSATSLECAWNNGQRISILLSPSPTPWTATRLISMRC
jgi:hypothetical protein